MQNLPQSNNQVLQLNNNELRLINGGSLRFSTDIQQLPQNMQQLGSELAPLPSTIAAVELYLKHKCVEQTDYYLCPAANIQAFDQQIVRYVDLVRY